MSSNVITNPIPDALRRFVAWRTGQTLPAYISIEAIFSRSEQFSSRNTVFPSVSSQVRTPIAQALDELEMMFDEENADGYTFKPTGYSYQRAKQILLDADSIMGRRFIRPSLVSDGEGGVNIRWRQGNKMVLCACRGFTSRQNYIYYQSGQEYDIVKGIPFVSLKHHLDWLLEQ